MIEPHEIAGKMNSEQIGRFVDRLFEKVKSRTPKSAGRLGKSPEPRQALGLGTVPPPGR